MASLLHHLLELGEAEEAAAGVAALLALEPDLTEVDAEEVAVELVVRDGVVGAAAE